MNVPRLHSILGRRSGWMLCLLCSSLVSSGLDSGQVKLLFADPPREFSSAPLWVWNDQLTEEQVVGTLQDLAAQKVKQVFVHPRPGLMTPYLGEAWFRLWKAAMAEAERLDMNVWIYDENSYPSGFAGGLVPDAMPESRGRGLILRDSRFAPKWESNMLAVFRLGGERPENLTARVRSGAALPDGQNYLIASIQRASDSPWHGGRSYVDLLYPGVTEKFLELTLEPYRREIGEHFGKRVPGIFTDEPNIIPAGGLPWTEDLPEQFKKSWGYDLVESLPSLRFEVGDWRRVRHNYFSVLNQLFIERWARPYSDRCEQLGLELTGHYWEHEWPHCKGVPDNMAMYAWQQRPGIDCLMNQYAENTHAQFGNARFVRELSSIANQLGKKRTLCEVYGAGGWDLRFEDMKRQADWLAVLGVNTFDQHLSCVTIRGARKRDHPQSFSYHEPWWDAYKVSAAYLERLTVAVAHGEQINSILVLEPTTTAWMFQGSEGRLRDLGDSFFKLLMSLEMAQVEYDLGCEDVMARHGSVQGTGLKIGQRSYQTVVLPPYTENLDGATWDLLSQYVAGGGKVIACNTPGSTTVQMRRDGGRGTNDAALTALSSSWQKLEASALPGVLREQSAPGGFIIDRAAGDKGILFHMRRQLEDGEILLLVNTSIEAPSSGRFTSKMAGVEKWDLETGKVARYSFQPTDEGVQAAFELPPAGSLLLFLSREPRVALPQASETAHQMGGSSQFEIRRTEPNVLVLDYVDLAAGGETRTNLYFYQANQLAFQKHGMERNPWDSAVQFKDEWSRKTFPVGSGFQVIYRFTIEQSVPAQLAIVIERPDLYTITCNGNEVRATPGAWWLDKAFGRIDLAEAARVGANEVTLSASPFTLYHEIEPAYVLGEFRLKASNRGFVIIPDQPLRWGAWNQQGHPFYAAGVSYQQQFNLGDAPTGEFVVSLPSWRGSVAKVIINGQLAGYISHAPWQCNITEYIWNGENSVEVIAIGTLKNTLGPHHGKPALGTAWPAMFQKGPSPGPPAGGEYHTVGYGLFQPFAMKQVVSP